LPGGAVAIVKIGDRRRQHSVWQVGSRVGGEKARVRLIGISIIAIEGLSPIANAGVATEQYINGDIVAVERRYLVCRTNDLSLSEKACTKVDATTLAAAAAGDEKIW
jgi:hypothetical protein